MLGQSLLAFDRTGSGKTLAYLVPILARIIQERFTKSPSCVIIAPTQELSKQIGAVLVSLDPTINVLLALGASDPGFMSVLKQGPQVVIGTGGRIASLVNRNLIDLKNVKILVIDELDALLDRDFRKSVNPLLSAIPPGSLQLLAFGATRTPELSDILTHLSAFSNAADVDLLSIGEKVPIKHSIVKVPSSSVERIAILMSLLCITKYEKAIVFTNTLDETRAIAQHPLMGSKARVFHGGLDVTVRDQILGLFKTGKISTLICTDITARGIDFPDVDLVISFRPPLDPVTYIHRAGRSGRMENRGRSILLISPSEKEITADIERIGKFRFQTEGVPKLETRRDAAIQRIVEEATQRGRDADQRLKDRVDSLIAQSPELSEKIASKCMAGILHDVWFTKSLPKFSILSGEPGYTPILFVDPLRGTIKNRGELHALIEKLGLRVGLVTLSESGFIVDVCTEHAGKIANTVLSDGSPIETVVLTKLPKIIKDSCVFGRKHGGVLPWRGKPHGKNIQNSNNYSDA